MKRTVARHITPAKAENPDKDKQRVGSMSYSLEQIQERASAKTEVLVAILQQEERPSWRHWGLNE